MVSFTQNSIQINHNLNNVQKVKMSSHMTYDFLVCVRTDDTNYRRGRPPPHPLLPLQKLTHSHSREKSDGSLPSIQTAKTKTTTKQNKRQFNQQRSRSAERIAIFFWS